MDIGLMIGKVKEFKISILKIVNSKSIGGFNKREL